MQYEQLPAVFDLHAAMKPDAPVIHVDRVKSAVLSGKERLSPGNQAATC